MGKWRYVEMCAKIYKSLKEMSWLQLFMMHMYIFINKSFVFTDILLRMTVALLALQLLVDKNSNGAISFWPRPVWKNTNCI